MTAILRSFFYALVAILLFPQKGKALYNKCGIWQGWFAMCRIWFNEFRIDRHGANRDFN